MRRISSVCAALVGIAALLGSISPGLAQTAPPNSINFQAKLTTPSGNPVPDGTYTLRVRFYNSAAGSNILHEQTLNTVAVKNGIIGVLIALFTADKFNGDTWLGIKLGSDPELTHQVQCAKAPPEEILSAAEFAELQTSTRRAAALVD